MKKLLIILLSLLVLPALLFANGQQASASAEPEQIVLRLGELNPDSHPCGMASHEFARLISERTDGRIKVEVYTSGQLGDQETQINQLVMGALDMYRTNPQFLNDFGVPVMKVLSLPYIFKTVDHCWNVLDSEIGTDFLASIEEANVGLVGVGWYAESARNYFFTDKKVTKVADMKGLKLRVPPSNMYMETTQAFGANPTPIAYSELYSALQTGVVDGAENPLSGYSANKFNEVAGYYTFDGHELSPSIMLFSQVKWEKLSAADQQIVNETWNETEAYIRVITEEVDKKVISDLTAQGIQFYEVDDKQEWIDAVQPLYSKYGEGYEDLISSIHAID
ncbi:MULTISPECIES: TRAP transporter substrate-binding protein [unclassified Oceanispirochaeta]|uniref:TRAP transporter substrate-binding protein n=1 Tax=unclassified Oceanispirochaeta TaxID=2635722 RepID=UPI00131490B8|nr:MULTISPECIES: TRAP transporter substrate-binding protein [unclassified Oceanispirochaeta]MBF9016580.1 TRAP transporter substrate-binding protein [Oceanispirochaeta sp. M2]NPD73043.1 TRAP transporter substrate-binding protein [Oceanispirochaeta sp. M1]